MQFVLFLHMNSTDGGYLKKKQRILEITCVCTLAECVCVWGGGLAVGCARVCVRVHACAHARFAQKFLRIPAVALSLERQKLEVCR